MAVRVVIAPDKFKGSLSAPEVADALAAGMRAVRSDWQIDCVPIADGGDGTVEAAVATGWTSTQVTAGGPTGVPGVVQYARDGTRAVVELAGAVGLARLPGGLDPLGAGTYGLGTVIADALDRGARSLVIGLGGSASTDGGAGMLQGLGARVLDRRGSELPSGGAALLDAAKLDLSSVHPAVTTSEFVLACDVDNPLLGSRGASAVYGPQKGAAPDQVELLDRALRRWADVVADATGTDLRDIPGAGAAGGAGFGAMAVLGAQARPGIELMLELVGFRKRLAGADLVVTGEGSLDEQSLHGKAPVGVATAAKERGVPVVAVAGRSLLGQDVLRSNGFGAAFTLAEMEPDVDRSIRNAAELLQQIGARIAREFG